MIMAVLAMQLKCNYLISEQKLMGISFLLSFQFR